MYYDCNLIYFGCLFLQITFSSDHITYGTAQYKETNVAKFSWSALGIMLVLRILHYIEFNQECCVGAREVKNQLNESVVQMSRHQTLKRSNCSVLNGNQLFSGNVVLIKLHWLATGRQYFFICTVRNAGFAQKS